MASLIRFVAAIPRLDLTRRVSLYSVLGLSVLYASGYFLPWLMPPGCYLLPSNDYLGLIVLPSVIAVITGIVLIYAVSAGARRWCDPRVATVCAVAALCLFTLIALKGIMYVAGYDWSGRLIPYFGSQGIGQRVFKLLLALLVFGPIWAARGVVPRVNRALASLGFGFAALAAVQIAVHLYEPVQTAATVGILRSLGAMPAAADARSRRVVWVIFDETDFQRVFGPDKAPGLEMPNYDWLSRNAVFATNANSPAKATVFSIPALLTGSPISGAGIRIDMNGELSLQQAQGGWMPFDEGNSIFGKISAGGRGVSILGFFHPYCKLFVTRQCDSLTWPPVGGWDEALKANIPGILLTHLGFPNYWKATTERGINLLPQYLVRDDALTFIHLNLPHPPATFADKTLHLAPSSDPLISYAHNLMLSDEILGTIVHTLREQSSRHELLLVVSTDHWLRKLWYRPSEAESSRPVPLIIWRVGEEQGVVLPQPLSTVHTASMILSYLNGEIDSQADIAQWWDNQPVYPSFLEPTK